jgi:transketolase N-terminal domain/subunit
VRGGRERPPTTALSLGQITTVLMFSAMRWSPDFPDYPTSDRLVLSSGHAVPIVYAAACKLGPLRWLPTPTTPTLPTGAS